MTKAARKKMDKGPSDKYATDRATVSVTLHKGTKVG